MPNSLSFPNVYNENKTEASMLDLFARYNQRLTWKYTQSHSNLVLRLLSFVAQLGLLVHLRSSGLAALGCNLLLQKHVT